YTSEPISSEKHMSSDAKTMPMMNVACIDLDIWRFSVLYLLRAADSDNAGTSVVAMEFVTMDGNITSGSAMPVSRPKTSMLLFSFMPPYASITGIRMYSAAASVEMIILLADMGTATLSSTFMIARREGVPFILRHEAASLIPGRVSRTSFEEDCPPALRTGNHLPGPRPKDRPPVASLKDGPPAPWQADRPRMLCPAILRARILNTPRRMS